MTELNLEEAAKFAKVHRDTIYRWVRKGTRFGKLPARQLPGGQWRIKQEDLELWITDAWISNIDKLLHYN
jgi:excisionase family DNA binding protein